jgi:hypothetical protein
MIDEGVVLYYVTRIDEFLTTIGVEFSLCLWRFAILIRATLQFGFLFFSAKSNYKGRFTISIGVIFIQLEIEFVYPVESEPKECFVINSIGDQLETMTDEEFEHWERTGELPK